MSEPNPGQVVRAISVVVPARDEQDRIADCVRHIAAAARQVPVPVSVTVVADNCRDDTVRIARRYADTVRIFSHNVGVARATGVARAAQRWSAARRAGLWLATTDADSLVPPEWLASHVAAAHRGADVVAGRVEVGEWELRSPTLRNAYLARYRAGANHGHVHGANLGVSWRCYQQLGGFAALPTGEDVDLVHRAQAGGHRVHWESTVPVRTSARRNGRAPDGFAAFLNLLEKEVEPCPSTPVALR